MKFTHGYFVKKLKKQTYPKTYVINVTFKRKNENTKEKKKDKINRFLKKHKTSRKMQIKRVKKFIRICNRRY